MVGVGRQSFADPHFATKILEGRVDDIKYCRTCQGCFRLVTHQERSGCVVYDKRYRESYRQLQQRIKNEKDSRGGGSCR